MTQSKADSSDYITALLSHDISNFNQTSQGYLEMLLADQIGELSDEQARVIGICLRQTNRIQSLIDAVRLLVALGRGPINGIKVDLDDAVEVAIQRVQKEFADREIRVSFTPAGRVALAEDHLECVFRHLLANAVQHNDSELVEIDVEITEAEGTPPAWKILVSDNGRGIPEGRASLLFSRLDSGDVHGSGFGLCLVKRLLERWGGEIQLEPHGDSQGAVFGLRVPRPAAS